MSHGIQTTAHFQSLLHALVVERFLPTAVCTVIEGLVAPHRAEASARRMRVMEGSPDTSSGSAAAHAAAATDKLMSAIRKRPEASIAKIQLQSVNKRAPALVLVVLRNSS